MKYDYDIAVIGAGSGGLTVAFGLAGAGKKVALIERWLIGGDCTNFGCVPSKALIDISKHNPELGFKKAMVEVRRRRQKIQDEETIEKIESHGLKTFKWTASFIDEHELKIEWEESTNIRADKIIISTGSSWKKIEIKWVDDHDILTNYEIFEQKEDIKKLIVMWGWYIGCELAESIAALWVEVHLIQRNNNLIPKEETESQELLQEIFESKWIKVHIWANVKYGKNKKLYITDIHGENEEGISYDKIFMALGRTANISSLGLDVAWIVYEKWGIVVDSYNRTNKKNIFAIWDCVSWNPQFTHWANNEGRGIIRNILLPFPKKSVRKMTLPAILYTHKEIARVGKSEEELLKKYTREEFITKIMYFENNDRSKVTNDTQGFVKIHFTRLTGKILWATILCSNAWELLWIVTSAIDNKISAYKLSKTIQAYPTKSELIKKVLDSYVIGTLGNIKSEIKFFLKSNILQIVTALIWISLIVLFFWYKRSYDLSFEQIALDIYNFLWWNIWWPIFYILIYTIRPIVLFPGTFMTFMSWALFWFWYGTVYTVIAGTFSAIFAYFMWQVFWKKLLSGEWGWIIGTLKKQVDSEPFMSVLMSRLLFFPYDITNYACWFLKVDLKKFILATCIGIIPGVCVFVLAGSAFFSSQITSFSQALSNVDTSLLAWAAVLFIITTIFAKILRKVKK